MAAYHGHLVQLLWDSVAQEGAAKETSSPHGHQDEKYI